MSFMGRVQETLFLLLNNVLSKKKKEGKKKRKSNCDKFNKIVLSFLALRQQREHVKAESVVPSVNCILKNFCFLLSYLL